MYVTFLDIKVSKSLNILLIFKPGNFTDTVLEMALKTPKIRKQQDLITFLQRSGRLGISKIFYFNSVTSHNGEVRKMNRRLHISFLGSVKKKIIEKSHSPSLQQKFTTQSFSTEYSQK